ncbi:P-loop containing nucleoside triphosphate hydrolase protein [Microdochium bolleyi]|uniref:p-loop containing nucleoside triphosphate hydrolase protein n=1 Tax=Microdochium bolleyi TaxID=196109 RepID=A0A136J211_9PEZI|nr:P-loop containing nucleoside triphosphate hydrolase protein [Microdochium bolleyi]
MRYAPPPPPQLRAIELHNTFIVIKSQHLAHALRAVVDYYPSILLQGPTPGIPAPYEVLYHHREQLARYKKRQPETHDAEYALTTARHIDVLLKFLDAAWGQKLHDEEALHARAMPLATSDSLWMLFKPGEVVFSKYSGKWTAFVVTQFVRGGLVVGGPPLPHRVHAWKLTYSGDTFNRTSHELRIEPFRGEQAIANLAVIPARFFRGADGKEEPAAVLAEQVRLGKLMWQLTQGPAYMSYEGNLASQEGDDDEWSHPTNTTGFMSGRVMVDCNGNDGGGYREYDSGRRRSRPPRNGVQAHIVVDPLPYFAARCDCEACGKIEAEPSKSLFAGFEGVRPKVDEMPASDLYFTVMYKVVDGFILGERRWGSFNVDQLRDVQFDREAFKFLVLDDEIKLTVKALIGKFASVQGRVSPWPNDFVRNKGQGRIFLLHGSPGVGKTCTAEATAELARRPLISLTAGDLGRHGHGVERSLDYFLKLGERFGAIVLLDEADVYLERRRTSDIARNGLVSVFLRALEYYRGVLFLTTNRVEMFDAAFTSRIHVALHYGPLTDEHREKIWLNSFERLERDSEGKVHISVATREYVYDSRDVRSLEWNGREIRNALQTAVALAETEALGDDLSSMGGGNDKSTASSTPAKITVTDKHLRAVVKMSRGFKVFAAERQLRDQYGIDDDESVRNEYDDDESDRDSII